VDMPMNPDQWSAGTNYYSEAVGPPQVAKDSYGRVWFRGGCRGWPTEGIKICTVPSDFKPQFTQWFPTTSYANSMPDALGLVTFNKNTGDIEYRTGTRDYFSLYLSGMMTPVAGTPWTTATYENGWTNNDAVNFGPTQYWKDPEGMVHIRGLPKGVTAGTTIFTLPAGYRPSQTILRATAALNAPGRVDILANGQVRHNSGSLTWFSLDNISFFPEQ